MRIALLSLVLLATTAHADLLSHDRLRAYVARLDVANQTYDDLDTSRVAFVFSAFVPGWGTYRLEKRVFGEVRPAGIIGDWGVGGLVPASLLVWSYYADDAHTRSTLRWTAAGLYAGTRVVILVIGNLHISEYRRALNVRFTTSANGAGVAFDF
jgi:hypothetical protein